MKLLGTSSNDKATKLARSSFFQRRGLAGNRRGIALLLVLTMLLLLSLLVVGLLISARQEVATAKSYSDSSDVRTLADMSANFVISQIARATNQSPYSKSNEDNAWISQPGLLRTFDTNGPKAAYKLYSSYNMIVNGSYDPLANEGSEVPTNWWDQSVHPNEFVDLNQPITLPLKDKNGTPLSDNMVYPIVDPNAVVNTAQPNLETGDPSYISASLTRGVEGFTYGPTIGNRNTPVPIQSDLSNMPPHNPLPMPVQWIYVTSDGKFLKSTDRTGDNDYKKASARIAFWADDETSKVNLNTACGGVFYDTPTVNTIEDQMLGRTQPIAQEYQRWPGHPSTTSIVPLFPQLRSPALLGTPPDPAILAKATATLAPRIGWGGSQGGTLAAWNQSNASTNSASSGIGGQVFLDSDRLFASDDELNYISPLSGASNATRVNDASSLLNSNLPSGVSMEKQIEQLRFFATVHSKAPELNIFNRPRVSMWPFNYELVHNYPPASNLTPEDRLLQFDTELGGITADSNGNVTNLDYTKRKRFYFQRESAWDSQADWQDIDENKALYTYLQTLTDKAIPGNPARTGGAGASFSSTSKFGAANRDEILTEMWDYIRSNVNNVNAAYSPVGLQPYSFPQNNTTETAGFNDVAPLVISSPVIHGVGSSKGIGRYPVPTEFIFQFTNIGDKIDPSDPTKVIRRVRLVLLVHFQSPIQHLQGSVPRFQMQVTADNPFQLALISAPAGATGASGMRIEGGGGWQSSLSSIGFPSTSFIDGTYRNIDYIDPVAAENYRGAFGGSYGIGLPFMAPTITQVGVNTVTGGGSENGKVLNNHKTGSPNTDEDNLAAAAITSRFSGNSGRDDIYYPFCSDVIEFQLPNADSTAAPHRGPFPAYGTTPIIAPATPKTDTAYPNVDYFNNVSFIGSNITITLYPGLNKTAKATDDISKKATWQTPDPTPITGNYFFKTTFKVDTCTIPLPRPLPANAGSGFINYDDATNSRTRQPLGTAQYDFLINMARTSMQRGPTPTYPYNNTYPYALDVLRSYVLDGVHGSYGDLRVVAARRDIPGSWYVKHALYDTPVATPAKSAFYAACYMPGGVGGSMTAPFSEKYTTPAPGLNSFTSPENINTVIGTQTDPPGNPNVNVQGRLGISGTPSTESFGWGWSPVRAASNATLMASRAGPGSSVVATQLGDFSVGFGDGPIGALVLGPDTGSGADQLSGATNFKDSSTISMDSPYYGFGGDMVSRSGGVVNDGSTSTSATGGYARNITGILFSPFKQVPSPVLFGTLPSRAWLSSTSTAQTDDPGPWETLLFSPIPASGIVTNNIASSGQSTHRGWQQLPRDHFLLDLFYMPVVEPYAITDDFATAGKINLNYQIAPFTYITRKTGMYALMDSMTTRWGPSERPWKVSTTNASNRNIDLGSALIAIPKNNYSSGNFRTSGDPTLNNPGTTDPNPQYRYYLDLPQTLTLFDQRFLVNDPFVSPSEICEMFLVPQQRNFAYPASASTIAGLMPPFYSNMLPTGDDKREMPYNHLYPRVTTRSNTFKVHFWVQTLNPKALQVAGTSDTAAPVVTGEYRGSVLVERYLDPSDLDPSNPDPNAPSHKQYGSAGIPSGGIITAGNIDSVFPFMNTMYKYRKIEMRQFSP